MKTSRRIGAICGLCLGICLLAFVWHKSKPGNHPAPAPVVAESPQSQQSPQQEEAPRERIRPQRAGVSSSVDRPAPSSSTAARLRAVQDELEAGDADAGRTAELAEEHERLTAAPPTSTERIPAPSRCQAT